MASDNTLGDRVKDLLDRVGSWLDNLMPQPAPVPVPVPVPIRPRR